MMDEYATHVARVHRRLADGRFRVASSGGGVCGEDFRIRCGACGDMR
jgi:hypothetical protein